jgi:hypothetical protein
VKDQAVANKRLLVAELGFTRALKAVAVGGKHTFADHPPGVG